MSSVKTTNLGLNDWQSSEPILRNELKENFEIIDDFSSKIKDKIINTTSLSYGLNSVIKGLKTPTFPKFAIAGKSYVNLLGKDGNCEDVSKWTGYQATLTLDSTNKVFGTNGIKITLSSTSASLYQFLPSSYVSSKYYCLTAYVKNGNASNMQLAWGTAGTLGQAVTDASKFTRIFAKVTGTVDNNTFGIRISGTNGQYGYIDGIMLTEITQAEYNDTNYTPPPYVDSYACLTNPSIEVRHDNLVRNGNGEEGVARWNINGNGVGQLSIEDGYFKLINSNSNGVFYNVTPTGQTIKPSTAYSYRIVAKRGTHPNGVRAYCSFYDSLGANVGTGYDSTVTATTDQVLTGTFTTPVNASKILIIFTDGVGGAGTGTNYVKEIMLVEGTIAPTSYLPCRIERCVIEGKFTSDDNIVFADGSVQGLVNWKHKTLYGKDYDWKLHMDLSGFKLIKMPNLPNSAVGYSSGAISTKYDGKVLLNGEVSAASDKFGVWTDGYTYLSVADSDTGWAESINPNTDEVKAFMNGWKATHNNGSRYDFWASAIVDPSTYPTNVDAFPKGVATTLSVAATNTTSITVNDGSIFKIGDVVSIFGVSIVTISGISGNVLSLGTSSGNAPIGNTVVKISTDILNYCKSNIAPNYEGYQLHYKLQTPEYLTKDAIKGEIPKLDIGDNYVCIDSGIVLGEVNTPAFDTGSNKYWINSTSPLNLLNNKLENFVTVYKNGQYDLQEFALYYGYREARGNYSLSIPSVDTSALYTVDYKILSTVAPNVGTVNAEYTADMTTLEKSLSEVAKNLYSVRDTINTKLELLGILAGNIQKPVEFDIPFVCGLCPRQNFKNTYWKNALGEVGITTLFQKSGTSDDIGNSSLIFTLPPGYRPRVRTYALATCTTVGGVQYQSGVAINTDGTVIVYLPVATNYMVCYFSIAFVAGN